MGRLVLNRFVVVWAAFVLVAGISIPARADEIWVAPTYQQDLGGIGVASNTIWPVTPAGAVRFAWAVPANLQTFQGAKLVLIPSELSLTPPTVTIQLCFARASDALAASCDGPFTKSFAATVDQLVEVDLSDVISTHLGTPGETYLSVLASTSPMTTTDHIVGLRFSYASIAPNVTASPDGTNSAPAIAFSSEPSLGFWRSRPTAVRLEGNLDLPNTSTISQAPSDVSVGVNTLSFSDSLFSGVHNPITTWGYNAGGLNGGPATRFYQRIEGNYFDGVHNWSEWYIARYDSNNGETNYRPIVIGAYDGYANANFQLDSLSMAKKDGSGMVMFWDSAAKNVQIGSDIQMLAQGNNRWPYKQATNTTGSYLGLIGLDNTNRVMIGEGNAPVTIGGSLRVGGPLTATGGISGPLAATGAISSAAAVTAAGGISAGTAGSPAAIQLLSAVDANPRLRVDTNADFGRLRLFDGANAVTHSFGGNQNNYIKTGNLGLGTTAPGSMLTVRGDIALTTSETGAGVMAISSTPPIVTPGTFGASAAVVAANGTVAFAINVGTGGSAMMGSLTLPTAANGWVVNCQDVSSPAAIVTAQTGGTRTTATLASFSRTTGLAAPWNAGDTLRCTAQAY